MTHPLACPQCGEKREHRIGGYIHCEECHVRYTPGRGSLGRFDTWRDLPIENGV